MSRYQPTSDEQAAIDLLTLAGYQVVRQRSYDALRERARVAEALRDMYREQVDSAHHWGMTAHGEQRRLTDRLTAVASAAAAQGVSITAINAALGETSHDLAPCPNCDSGEHPTCSGCGQARDDVVVRGGS